jgi:predicted N-acetyltransferase YhbS
MEIKYLSEYKEWIPTIADWFYNEWREFYPIDSVNYVIESIQKRTNTDRIPLTLVAIGDDTVIGTVCLKEFDMDTRKEFSPWLAGLYVRQDHRKKGIGTTLVRAIVSEAKRLRVKDLYLWTQGSKDLYIKLGWSVLENTEYKGKDVTIMIRKLI